MAEQYIANPRSKLPKRPRLNASQQRFYPRSLGGFPFSLLTPKSKFLRECQVGLLDPQAWCLASSSSSLHLHAFQLCQVGLGHLLSWTQPPASSFSPVPFRDGFSAFLVCCEVTLVSLLYLIISCGNVSSLTFWVS